MTVVMAQGAKAATIVEYEVAREQSAGSTWWSTRSMRAPMRSSHAPISVHVISNEVKPISSNGHHSDQFPTWSQWPYSARAPVGSPAPTELSPTTMRALTSLRFPGTYTTRVTEPSKL
jgi:hypothetical protein